MLSFGFLVFFLSFLSVPIVIWLKNFTDMYNSCNLNVGNPLSSTGKKKNNPKLMLRKLLS